MRSRLCAALMVMGAALACAQTKTPLRQVAAERNGPGVVVVLPGEKTPATAVVLGWELVQVNGTWTLRPTGPSTTPTWAEQTWKPATTTMSVTLAAAPLPNSQFVFKGGVYMTVGEDYVISGTSINFTNGVSVEPGEVLTVKYQK